MRARFDEIAKGLRIRLEYYFRHHLWRPEDSSRAEDCVQETLFRLARKVAAEDEEIINLEAYSLGIAKLVLLESRKSAHRERDMEPLADDEHQSVANRSEESALELQDTCLRRCLSELSEVDRELVSSWHAIPRGAGKVELHREMQQSFGTASTLRVRIFRIVKRLRTCCADCMQRETNQRGKH